VCGWRGCNRSKIQTQNKMLLKIKETKKKLENDYLGGGGVEEGRRTQSNVM
jgi:hypothetical protein